MKAFDLTGKVAVVTGTVSPDHQKRLTNTLPQDRICCWTRGIGTNSIKTSTEKGEVGSEPFPPQSPHRVVLAQPPNQHVMKAFDLTGKVAVVTGTVSPDHQKRRPWRPLQIVSLIVMEHRVVWLTFAPASANALEISVLKSRGHWLKPVQM
jgi:hypothetical protein